MRKPLTRPQIEACWRKYQTSDRKEEMSYLQWRRECVVQFNDCLMIPNWCGMVVGVEADGYTHT